MPARPSACRDYSPDDLPWPCLIEACARKDAGVLESLWVDEKRPEQARAAAIRSIFEGACVRGYTDLAQWAYTLYPQHVTAKVLQDSGAASIRTGQTKVWDVISGFIDAHHAPQKIFEKILRTSAQYATPQILEKLWPYAGERPSSLLYAAALGDNMPALKWMTKACQKENSLHLEDINKALILAARNGHLPMLAWLLFQGADASAHDDAPLRLAFAHADSDNGALIEALVRAGAHPDKAQKMAMDAGMTEIAARLRTAAAETQKLHMEVLHKICGNPFAGAQLCSAHEAIGGTGLHYAARHRILDQLSTVLFDTADLMQKNDSGQTVLDVLCQRGDMERFCAPARWTGHIDKLKAVFSLLPDSSVLKERQDQLLRQAEQLTLHQRARQFQFRPTPRY